MDVVVVVIPRHCFDLGVRDIGFIRLAARRRNGSMVVAPSGTRTGTTK